MKLTSVSLVVFAAVSIGCVVTMPPSEQKRPGTESASTPAGEVSAIRFVQKNDRAGGRGTFSYNVTTTASRSYTGCAIEVKFLDGSGMELESRYVGNVFPGETIPAGSRTFTESVQNKRRSEVDAIKGTIVSFRNCIAT